MKSFKDLQLNDLENPIWVYDATHFKIAWANQAALKIWESSSIEELSLRDFKPSISDAANEKVINILRECISGRSIECWWRIDPLSGVKKQVFITCSAINLEDGRPALLVEAIHSELLNQLSGEMSKNSMFAMLNEKGYLLSSNPIFEDQFGNSVSHFNELKAGQNSTFHDITLKLPFESDELLTTLNGPRWHRVEYYQKYKSSYLFVTLRDIHNRKTNELQLAKESVTDPLTGLLNRRGLYEQLEKLTSSQYTLFYIDLDGFKPINDSYGHSVGDHFLRKIAGTLQKTIHPDALCSRLGGDEFIVLINTPLKSNEQLELAAKLSESLSRPVQLDQHHRAHTTASIGVADNRDSTTPDKAIMRTDAAMYFAKRSGRNRAVLYENGMENHLLKNSIIVQHLENALENNELKLYHQIIHKKGSEHVVGVEALLRWNHPTLGTLSPLDIIAAAEDTGRISTLENWIIRQACLDLSELRNVYGPQLTMGINISGAHLSQTHFMDNVLAALKETNTTPADIVFELTESTLVNALTSDNSTLKTMCDAGFTFAIDDFGTGYSSLAYLHEIPAQFVKVDKNFVDRITQDSHTIRFIQELCQNLNLVCLIEGVETEEQAQLLDQLNIDYRQGYLYGRPLPVEEH